MDEHQGPFQFQLRSGEPVTLGDVTITPQARALSLRWPNGGFVWNLPVAILAERGGETERIPIVNVVLVAQIAFLGLALGTGFVFLILSLVHRRN